MLHPSTVLILFITLAISSCGGVSTSQTNEEKAHFIFVIDGETAGNGFSLAKPQVKHQERTAWTYAQRRDGEWWRAPSQGLNRPEVLDTLLDLSSRSGRGVVAAEFSARAPAFHNLERALAGTARSRIAASKGPVPLYQIRSVAPESIRLPQGVTRQVLVGGVVERALLAVQDRGLVTIDRASFETRPGRILEQWSTPQKIIVTDSPRGAQYYFEQISGAGSRGVKVKVLSYSDVVKMHPEVQFEQDVQDLYGIPAASAGYIVVERTKAPKPEAPPVKAPKAEDVPQKAPKLPGDLLVKEAMKPVQKAASPARPRDGRAGSVPDFGGNFVRQLNENLGTRYAPHEIAAVNASNEALAFTLGDSGLQRRWGDYEGIQARTPMVLIRQPERAVAGAFGVSNSKDGFAIYHAIGPRLRSGYTPEQGAKIATKLYENMVRDAIARDKKVIVVAALSTGSFARRATDGQIDPVYADALYRAFESSIADLRVRYPEIHIVTY